jgi:hypothetical protein
MHWQSIHQPTHLQPAESLLQLSIGHLQPLLLGICLSQLTSQHNYLLVQLRTRSRQLSLQLQLLLLLWAVQPCTTRRATLQTPACTAAAVAAAAVGAGGLRNGSAVRQLAYAVHEGAFFSLRCCELAPALLHSAFGGGCCLLRLGELLLQLLETVLQGVGLHLDSLKFK